MQMDSATRKTFFGSRQNYRDQPDLSQWQSCTRLLLDHNELRILHQDFFPPQPKIVHLDRNRLYNDGLLHRWPESIEELVLSHNMFRDTSFTAMWPSHLKTLDLSDTPLDTMPHNLPETLETLNVSYTDLRTLEHLPEQLKTLHAYYCRLTEIQQLPATLTHCNLGYNLLSSRIFFQQLPTLTYLNLSGNRLTWIPGNLPDSIETLLLSNNALTELPETLPKNLLQLNVSSNRIRQWTPKWKLGQRIQHVDIRYNCLTQPPETLTGSGVVTLYYADNWNLTIHHVCAKLIQNRFRLYMLHKMLRQLRRLKKFRGELFEIAYHPDIMGRWNIPETWNEWKH